MVHKGTAAGGHYIAYIKDFETNEWFSFNDQNVKKVCLVKKCKIFLFFKFPGFVISCLLLLDLNERN